MGPNKTFQTGPNLVNVPIHPVYGDTPRGTIERALRSVDLAQVNTAKDSDIASATVIVTNVDGACRIFHERGEYARGSRFSLEGALLLNYALHGEPDIDDQDPEADDTDPADA